MILPYRCFFIFQVLLALHIPTMEQSLFPHLCEISPLYHKLRFFIMWVSFWTLVCFTDLFVYQFPSPNHSFSSPVSCLIGKISLMILYFKKKCCCYSYIFSLPEYSFLSTSFKIPLTILFEISPSMEGNWLFYSIEFFHPRAVSISSFFSGLQEWVMVFSNKFCAFLHRATLFQSFYSCYV